MAAPELALSLEPGQTHRLGSALEGWADGLDHHHDGGELLWFRRRGATLRVAGRVVEVRAGSLLLIGPGLVHGFVQPPGDDLLLLHFSGEESPLAGTDAWRSFLPFVRAARRGLLLERPLRHRPLRDALSRLAPSGDLLGLWSLTELAHQLCQQSWQALTTSSVIGDPLTTAPAWMHSLCARINARLTESLTLARLTELGGIRRSALCSAFQHYYGCGPMTWVARRRLLRAAEMLVASDRKVIDIAYACGFTCLSTFNRRFIALHGRSPGHWRADKSGLMGRPSRAHRQV